MRHEKVVEGFRVNPVDLERFKKVIGATAARTEDATVARAMGLPIFGSFMVPPGTAILVDADGNITRIDLSRRKADRAACARGHQTGAWAYGLAGRNNE